MTVPTATTTNWMHLLGMPYRICADPTKHDATDCIHLVFHILDLAGQDPPAFESKWYPMLARDDRQGLRAEWMRLSRPAMGPENLTTTLIPSTTFAIAIVIDGGLLTVTPENGVRWIPLSAVQPLNYRRLITRHEQTSTAAS